MFIEAQDTSGDTVWFNTATVTFIEDRTGDECLTVHFRYGDLFLARSEKKKLLAALRRIGLEGGPR